MLKAKLVVVGGDAKSTEVKLKTLPCVIGRGKEATLTLPHPLVSRQHTELFERDGRLWVRDMGSLNGTFLNNKRLETEQPLDPNQLLTLGNVTFRAVYEPLDDQETDLTPLDVGTLREPPGSEATDSKRAATSKSATASKGVAATEEASASESDVDLPDFMEEDTDAESDDDVTDGSVVFEASESGLSGLSMLDEPVKKPVVKKPAIKKAAGKKVAARQQVETVAVEDYPAKKTADKKPAARRPDPGAGKSANNKPAAVKRSADKKPVEKKPTAKTPVKKSGASDSGDSFVDLDSGKNASPTSDTNKSSVGTSEVFVTLDDTPSANKSVSLSSLDGLPVTPAAMSFTGMPVIEDAEAVVRKTVEAVEIDLGEEQKSSSADDDVNLDSFINKLPR